MLFSQIVATATTSSSVCCVAVEFLRVPLAHVALCLQSVFVMLSLVSPVDRFV